MCNVLDGNKKGDISAISQILVKTCQKDPSHADLLVLLWDMKYIDALLYLQKSACWDQHIRQLTAVTYMRCKADSAHV